MRAIVMVCVVIWTARTLLEWRHQPKSWCVSISISHLLVLLTLGFLFLAFNLLFFSLLMGVGADRLTILATETGDFLP